MGTPRRTTNRVNKSKAAGRPELDRLICLDSDLDIAEKRLRELVQDLELISYEAGALQFPILAREIRSTMFRLRDVRLCGGDPRMELLSVIEARYEEKDSSRERARARATEQARRSKNEGLIENPAP